MPTDNTEDRDDVAAAPALDASEESPLLPPQTPDTDEDRYTDQESAQKLERQNVLILVGVIIFLIGTFAGTFTPPINQIMEDILCRQYHPDVYGSVKPDDPDSICKSQDVQQQLAMLRGWAATFDCIPGILLGVPYGILSDSWGRKPVTVLSFVGLCLNCILFLIVRKYTTPRAASCFHPESTKRVLISRVQWAYPTSSRFGPCGLHRSAWSLVVAPA